MVASLEETVTLCTTIGGETGRVLRLLIEAEAVTLDAVDTGAANGVYVHDRRLGERSVIVQIPGESLARHESDDLASRAIVAGLESGATVLAGQPAASIVPVELRRRLAEDLRANGRQIVADLTG